MRDRFPKPLEIAGISALALLLGSISPAYSQDTPISAIQAADHRSPMADGGPIDVKGIVTGIFGKGFFLQSQQPDGSPATSEGIYVFLGSSPDTPMPEIGREVSLKAKVIEFQPFPELPIPRERKIVECGTTNVTIVPTDDRTSFLAMTELTNVESLVVGELATLPAPMPLEPPGTNTSIAFADRPSTPFNPSEHPRDYFESLEGMRVIISDALVVSRKEERWDAFWVAAEPSLSAAELSAYGLPIELPGHIFPEIFQVHVAAGQGSLPLAPGTRLGDLTGVLTYENGDYMVVLDAKIDPATLVPPEIPSVASQPGTGMSLVTYNALNISAVSPASKFKAIAAQLTDPLAAPDIIALQEIQDDDGNEITNVVSAGATLAKLVTAIADAGGPAYQVGALDPVLPNTDGGEPGGNIRNVILIRADSGIGIVKLERLFDNEQRCDRDVNAFANSRKPLLAELSVNGELVVLVNVHLSSKLGDQGLYSNAEDPQPDSDTARRRQAEALATELEARYGTTRPKIIIVGDFNDHHDAMTLDPLRQSTLGFEFLHDSRGASFSFSHEFHGLRAAIDHVVIGGTLEPDLIGSLNYMNLNVDRLDRASDHNPVRLIIK